MVTPALLSSFILYPSSLLRSHPDIALAVFLLGGRRLRRFVCLQKPDGAADGLIAILAGGGKGTVDAAPFQPADAAEQQHLMERCRGGNAPDALMVMQNDLFRCLRVAEQRVLMDDFHEQMVHRIAILPAL